MLIRAALPAWRTAAGLEAEHVVEWDRGFPTNILESPGGLSARWFVKVAPDLARRIPLTRLSLMYTDRATCEQLCILPELSQLRELSLNGHMGADQELKAAIAEVERRYTLYRNIPYEADAHEVGDSAEQAFKGWP